MSWLRTAFRSLVRRSSVAAALAGPVARAAALGIAVLLLAPALGAAESHGSYESGHQALEVWDAEGRANAPPAVRIWILVMLASFLPALVFAWRHVEARFVAGGVLGGLVASQLIVGATGIVPLSGYVALVHLIFWSPALVLLLMRQPFRRSLGVYSIWSGWVTLVILISFVFDIRDAVIYLVHIVAG